MVVRIAAKRGDYTQPGGGALSNVTRRPVVGCTQAEPAGVERHPSERVRPTPVLAVAGDRMAQVGELDADLMAASGAERQREDRRVAAPRAHLIVRDRRLARRPRADPQGAILREPALERAARRADAPLHHRDVLALGRPRLELRLQMPLRLGRLRDDDEPGRVAVEAMDDEGPARGPLGGEVVPEEPVRGALPLALRRDGEETRGLVDHEEIAVLMHQPERRGEWDAARATLRF